MERYLIYEKGETPIFAKFNLHPDLLRGIKDMGYTRPTPVQEQAIPEVLKGHDLIATAQTGTGKTAAFLIPLMHRILHNRGTGIRVLILTPTRELAAQIDEQATALGYHTKIRCAAVYGGVGFDAQENALRTGFDIIAATPGRLMDHLRRGYAKFNNLEVLVLDEADRMLDMGFMPDIKRILSYVPAKRQTLLYSATMPQEIIELTHVVLKDPVTVRVGREAPPSGIRQAMFPVERHLKTKLLIKLLEQQALYSVLVFVRSKHSADSLVQKLRRHGVDSEVIHGDKSQTHRREVLHRFKKGDIRVLVATDIAARGIDFTDITHVINYDVPQAAEDYIHRIGRTARKDTEGDAFIFVTPQDNLMLRDIEKLVNKKLPAVLLPDFDYNEKPPTGYLGGGHPHHPHHSRPQGHHGDSHRPQSHYGQGQGHSFSHSQHRGPKNQGK